MNFRIFSIGFLFILLLFSCRNTGEESYSDNSEKISTGTPQDFQNEISSTEREAMINELQGTWKEPEYPFGEAQFRDTLVKFIEEGVVEAPRFRQYRLSRECPFEVNNIKNTVPDDVILVVAGAETCEKLAISNDTLTLSGFSAHTGEDYSRIYLKEE